MRRNLREPGGHYRFFGFPPQRPRMPPHAQRDAYLRDCAARFAHDLETILKRAPLQWYNFYPFWEPAESTRNRSAVDPDSPNLSAQRSASRQVSRRAA